MPINVFHGDAAASTAVQNLTVDLNEIDPNGLVTVTLHGAEPITFHGWDPQTIVTAWNNLSAPYSDIVASSSSPETIRFTAKNPGTDFLITATVRPEITVTEIQPGQAGVDQIASLTLPESTTGGSWTITLNGQTTSNLAYDISAGDLLTALESLSNVTAGDVVVTKSDFIYTIETSQNFAETAVSLNASGANLLGNVTAVIAVTAEAGGGTPHVLFLGGYDPYSPINATFVQCGASHLSWYVDRWYQGSTSNNPTEGQTFVDALRYVLNESGHTDAVIHHVEQNTHDQDVVFIVSPTEFTDTLTIRLVNGTYVDADVLNDSTSGINNTSFILYHNSGTTAGTLAVNGGTPEAFDIKFTGSTSGYDDWLDNLFGSGNWERISPRSFNSSDRWEHQVIKLTGAASATQHTLEATGFNLLTLSEGGPPANETQSITFSGSPTGGTFTITYDGQTTSALNHGDAAATVQTALEALTNLTSGDVSVSGNGSAGNPYLIEFTGNLAETDVPLVSVDATAMTGGTIIAEVVSSAQSGFNERQQISISDNVLSGTFTLRSAGGTSTAIAYNATAAQMLAALDAAPQASAADYLVTKTGIGTWEVEFQGIFARKNQSLMSAPDVGNLLDFGEGVSFVEVISIGDGPTFWNRAGNWSLGRVPDSGDDVYLDRPRINLLEGLRQLDTWAGVQSAEQVANEGTDNDLLKLTHPIDLVEGQIVRLTTTDTLPTGLLTDTDYFVRNVNRSAGTLQLATVLNGTPIEFTGNGSGTHTIAVELQTLNIMSRFTGEIGWSRFNASGGYFEWHNTHLRIGLQGDRKITIGDGEGTGSGKIRIDVGDYLALVNVLNTGASRESGVPALLFLGQNIGNEFGVYSGDVGIAFYPEEKSTVGMLQQRGGTVHLENVQLGGLDKTAGTLTSGAGAALMASAPLVIRG